MELAERRAAAEEVAVLKDRDRIARHARAARADGRRSGLRDMAEGARRHGPNVLSLGPSASRATGRRVRR